MSEEDQAAARALALDVIRAGATAAARSPSRSRPAAAAR